MERKKRGLSNVRRNAPVKARPALDFSLYFPRAVLQAPKKLNRRKKAEIEEKTLINRSLQRQKTDNFEFIAQLRAISENKRTLRAPQADDARSMKTPSTSFRAKKNAPSSGASSIIERPWRFPARRRFQAFATIRRRVEDTSGSARPVRNCGTRGWRKRKYATRRESPFSATDDST